MNYDKLKENYIVSVISEILWYKQTNREPNKHPATLLYGYDSYNSLSYMPRFELEFLDKLRKNLPQDHSGTINTKWFS